MRIVVIRNTAKIILMISIKARLEVPVEEVGAVGRRKPKSTAIAAEDRIPRAKARPNHRKNARRIMAGFCFPAAES
jgi:hypothetical protein